MTQNYISIFDGEKWIVELYDETIKNLFNMGKLFLKKRIQYLYDSNDKRSPILPLFDRFFDDIKDVKKVKYMFQRIKMFLYNNRHIPINTKNTVESDTIN